MRRTLAVLASVAFGLSGLVGCSTDTPVVSATPAVDTVAQVQPGANTVGNLDEQLQKTTAVALAAADEYVTVKGRIVFDGDEKLTKMEEIVPTQDKDACLKNGKFSKEDWIVDPKTKGLKNVIVWIGPDDKRGAAFPQDKIHPKLKDPPAEPVVIDQPCCQYIPHVSAVRVGQKLVGMNSATIPHNFKWDSSKNGSINPLLQPKGKATVEIQELEPRMNLATCGCTIHTWMKAWVAIFDHPYFAITNDKGEFEIKMVPKGNFRLFARHPIGGFINGEKGAQGEKIQINDNIDLKDLKFKAE